MVESPLRIVLYLLVSSILFCIVYARSAYDSLGSGVKATVEFLPDQEYFRKAYERRYRGPETRQCDLDEHRRKQAESASVPEEEGVHEIWLQPHTHDDVGWEWTVGGYFENSVRHILDSVTADLAENPSHRFIWSEIKWIEMWWSSQNETTRANFKKIVQNGQLEFVGAGWSQHDEVTPSYRDMIANTVTGHEFLRRILGPLDSFCPGPHGQGRGRCIRFGWQIDMFAGYSAASPTLCAMAGYDGMVLRFEGPDSMRSEWNGNKSFELLWEGSAVLSANRSRTAAHIIRWNYGDMLMTGRNGSAYGFRSPAISFAFDTVKLKTQEDIEKYAKELVYWSRNRGSVYRGNRHLAVWGSDFQFTNAGLWFQQMDLLIAEINGNVEKYNAKIRYTTLSEYFDHLHSLQLHENKKVKASSKRPGVYDFPLPVKKMLDFEFGWPHSFVPIGVPAEGLTQNFSVQYQTGAASSRPAHKRASRKNAAQLRAAQNAHATALATGAIQESLANEFEVAWDALGVMQHHDSMPGTMRAYESVTCPDNVPIINGLDECNRTTDKTRQCLEDYTARLAEADNATSNILRSSLEALVRLPTNSLEIEPSSENNALLVFNPTMITRSELLRFEFVPPSHLPSNIIPSLYRVDSGKRTAIQAQMEVNDRFQSQLTISHVPPPLYAKSLYFIADRVPPLGVASFEIEFDPTGKNSTTTALPEIFVGPKAVANEGLGFNDDPNCQKLDFDASDGLMKSIEMQPGGLGCNANKRKEGGDVLKASMRQTYWQYIDGPGGAYCMIEQTKAVEVPKPFRVALTKGPVLQEVVQSFAYGSGLVQRVRLSGATHSIDVFHSSGRLPGGRELVSRIESDIQNQRTLYTEASGFGELYERNYNATASIAQNYHALVQTAVIRDNAPSPRQLSILSRRTMAVASLESGSIEYMTARRISTESDSQGPWPLDDKLPQHDVIRIMLAPQESGESKRFAEAVVLEHPLEQFYFNAGEKAVPLPFGADGLPENVWSEMFVRLDAPEPSSFAIRIQNIIPGGDPITIKSLQNALGFPSMNGCVEMTSTLQQSRAENDAVRLKWKSEENVPELKLPSLVGSEHSCKSSITLSPLDIRTFTFSIKDNRDDVSANSE